MALEALNDPVDELLWTRWCRLAERNPQAEAVVFWAAGENPQRWSRGALMAAASSVGQRLQSEGIKAGDVCALIIRHHSRFYPLYMGIESIGAIPAVLAYPNNRIHPDKFRHGLSGMAKHSGLDWILTEKDLLSVVEPLINQDGSTIRGVICPLDWEQGASLFVKAHPKAKLNEACLLQHSSGTTGLQKGVMLTHRDILVHAKNYGNAIQANVQDKVVSWLPLYHDMGLIASFHIPLALGIPTVQLNPFEWVTVPSMLLSVLSSERGTLSWLPNFAFNHMAQRVQDDELEGVRLDHVRMLVNCSEPVRAESHDLFLKRFESYGIGPHMFSASYALAETTFAVTQTSPGKEPARLKLNRSEINRGRVVLAKKGELTRVCVSSGQLVSGCKVRVVNESEQEVDEKQVGELLLSSDSMFDGYRKNPEKTAEVLKEGWLHSGDVGFVKDGEYYVIGRKKDVIIVAGKNIFPEDIEDIARDVEGVIPGRVVVFGVEDTEIGTEKVCLIAETEVSDPLVHKKIQTMLVQKILEIDVTLSRVYLAPPRWLVKSSAGKLSRQANRDRALAELKPV